jgi:hypothetical protein
VRRDQLAARIAALGQPVSDHPPEVRVVGVLGDPLFHD